jgi:hypothetical protein
MKTNLTLLTILASLLFFLSSCGETTKNNPAQTSIASTYTVDTSIYAVLKFDTTYTWLFKNAKPSSLTQTETEEIDSILKQCIDAYNPDQQLLFDTISTAHPEYNLKVGNFIINLSKYKRQYFPVINSAGQKEIWVNCFCNDFEKNWRKEMLIVKDGGNCYFSLVINLATKTFSRFIVNGDA